MKDISWARAKDLLISKLSAARIEISLDDIWPFLVRYAEALEEGCQRLNLTAIKTRKDRVLIQFFESLVLAVHLPNNSKAADLGSGGGIPGLIVKIARQDLDITLIEALSSRVNFMNSVIEELGLENIRAVTCHLGKTSCPGSFPLVFSRGYGGVIKFTRHAEIALSHSGKAYYLWRKGIEPWGEGNPALQLVGEIKVRGLDSALLVWKK